MEQDKEKAIKNEGLSNFVDGKTKVDKCLKKMIGMIDK